MSDPTEAGRLASGWRDAAADDVEAIAAIERAVHTLPPERPAVFREKLSLFGQGCRVLLADGRFVGYGIAFPWRRDDVPALDRFIGRIPRDADCLFIHDVAILPEARGRGAAQAFVDHAARLAHRLALPSLALVSVYGTHQFWGRCGFALAASPATSDKLAPYGETARYMVASLS